MILSGFTTPQILFIILTPIVVIGLLVVFVFIPLTKRHNKNHFKEYCHKAIYKIAFNEDYYLINNFLFRVDSTRVARIDHILFGEKYIYVIIDAYFEGDLVGKETDKSLILINKRNQKFYTDNQYAISKSLVKYLSNSTGIAEDLFVGIVVVNNNCKLGIETNNKQYYLIQRNKIKKLVKAIESRDVGKINAAQLESAVKAIDKSNRAKKNGQGSQKTSDK